MMSAWGASLVLVLDQIIQASGSFTSIILGSTRLLSSASRDQLTNLNDMHNAHV
uniref:Uncharacterized protein n=1 Tax=Zea mays TaxID=4577 RepID=C0P2P5_MAIZE|nr:unknown [Zea mays]